MFKKIKVLLATTVALALFVVSLPLNVLAMEEGEEGNSPDIENGETGEQGDGDDVIVEDPDIKVPDEDEKPEEVPPVDTHVHTDECEHDEEDFVEVPAQGPPMGGPPIIPPLVNVPVNDWCNLENMGRCLDTVQHVTVLNSNGDDLAGLPEYVMQKGESITVRYNWGMPEGALPREHTCIFLPPAIKLYNDISGDIVDNGKNIGTYLITKDNNKILLNYFDDAVNMSNVTGSLNVQSTFDYEYINNETTYTVDFPINNGTNISINVNFETAGSDKSIQKSGVAKNTNGEASTNKPEYIDWTVDVNTDLKSRENVLVLDVIGNGAISSIPADHVFVPGSMIVHEIQMGSNGSVVGTVGAALSEVGAVELQNAEGAIKDSLTYAVSMTPQTGVDCQEIKISFGNINKAYRVFYRSEIRTRQSSYGNIAYLDGASASASVGGIRWATFSKTGKGPTDAYDKKAIWTIEFNTSKQQLGEVTLTDKLGEGQVYVTPLANNVKVYKYNGDTIDTSYNYFQDYYNATASGGNIMVLKFPAGSDAYRVEYGAEITDFSKYEKGGEGLFNTVTDGEVEIVAYIPPRSDTLPEIKNKLEKTANPINYATRTVDWKVTIKPLAAGGLPINTLLEDVFMPDQAGLPTKVGTLILDVTSVVIKYGSTGLPMSTTEYVLVPLAADVNSEYKIGFAILFLAPLKGQDYILTYTTKLVLDPNSNGQLGDLLAIENLARMNNLNARKKIDISQVVRNNIQKYGEWVKDHAVADIRWKIDLNYWGIPLGEQVLIDTLGDGHIFVPESIKVYRSTYNSNGYPQLQGEAELGKDYTIDYVKDQNDIIVGFIMVFLNINNNEGFQVQYYSEIVNHSLGSFRNNYNFNGKDYYATVWRNTDGAYITKSGKQSEPGSSIMDWEITLNKNRTSIKNAVVEDKLGEGQYLNESSLVVSIPARLNNPEIVLQKDTDYYLSVKSPDFSAGERSQSFVIQFVGAYSTLYDTIFIKYSSIVTNYTPVDPLTRLPIVTNEAWVKGDGFTDVPVSKVERMPTSFSMAFADASGLLGSVVLKKADAKDKDKILSGTVFELYDSNNIKISTSTTGSDGTFTIDGLKLGKYTLVETVPPTGYTLPEKEENRKVSFEITEAVLNLSITFYNSTNEKDDPPPVPKINQEPPVSTPKTGDSKAIYLALAFLVLSGSFLVAVSAKKRKFTK